MKVLVLVMSFIFIGGCSTMPISNKNMNININKHGFNANAGFYINL